MALICLITMANVLVRYFTDISFAFTEEISIVLMVVMTLVGAAARLRRQPHIAITFFVDLLGRAAAASRAALALLAAAGACSRCSLVLGTRMAWDD